MISIHIHADWIKVNRQTATFFFFSAALCDAYFSPSSQLLMDKIRPIQDVFFFCEFPVSLRSMMHYGSRILIAFEFTLTLSICANQNVSDVYSSGLSEKLLDIAK